MHRSLQDLTGAAPGESQSLENVFADDQPPAERSPLRILVIDSVEALRDTLTGHLAEEGYEVVTAASVSEAIGHMRSVALEAILMDVTPDAGPTFDDIALLRELTQCRCIVATSSDASPRAVVECMRHGAVDFLPKPFDPADASAVLRHALGSIGIFADSPGRARIDTPTSMLLGVSSAIHEIRKIAHRAAKTDLNCLIRGESGVGKDVVAREIHRLSQRHDMPFVKVNCSALPELLLESELFGYEKGAFTGADRSKPGRFSLAHGGIIFLDEIGDMDPGLQAKILQVIEHKEFTKLGGREPQKVDVQIIAATNSNLEEKIAVGTFRHDLFFRLNEISILVPPLRHRPEDIPVLIEHFTRKHGHCAAGAQRHMSAGQLEMLREGQWLGNIRELENTIKRWLAVGTLNMTPTRPSPTPMHAAAPFRHTAQPEPQGNAPTPQFIHETLEKYQWNRREAAKALGIGYSTLRRAIQKYDLDRRPFQKA